MASLVGQFGWRLAEDVFFFLFMLMAMGGILLSHERFRAPLSGQIQQQRSLPGNLLALALLMRRKLRTAIGAPVKRDAGIGQEGVDNKRRAGLVPPCRYSLVNDVIDRCFFHGPLARLRVTVRQS